MRALGFDVKKADVLKLMKEYDRNETGQIEYADFGQCCTTLCQQTVRTGLFPLSVY